jgi:hypothetical protein
MLEFFFAGFRAKTANLQPLGRVIVVQERFNCLSQRLVSGTAATQSQGAKVCASRFLQCRSAVSFETREIQKRKRG